MGRANPRGGSLLRLWQSASSAQVLANEVCPKSRPTCTHAARFPTWCMPTTAFPLLALRRDELLSKSPSRVYTRCVILDGGGSFQPPDARNRVPRVHTLRDFRHGRSPLGALSQLAGRHASLLSESASRVYTRGSISGTAKPDGKETKSRGARATRTRSRGKVPPLIHATLAASLAALLYESFVGAPQLGIYGLPRLRRARPSLAEEWKSPFSIRGSLWVPSFLVELFATVGD